MGGWRSTQKKRCSLPAIGWRSEKEKKRCSSDWDQSHLIEDNPIRPNDKDSRCNRFSSQIQPPPTLTSITHGGKQRKRRWEEFSLTFLHFDHFWPREEQEVGQTQWYQRRASLLISERPGNGSGRLTLIHCLYLICFSFLPAFFMDRTRIKNTIRDGGSTAL